MDEEQRMAILELFSWENFQLAPEERAVVERLLVKYHRIFAPHGLDIGINNEFRIKLTPGHDELVYAQTLLTPTNLKKDMSVELAFSQEYDILTTLLFSEYLSPILAQRKPNRIFRLFVVLRPVNHLLKHEYNEHDHPVKPLLMLPSVWLGRSTL